MLRLALFAKPIYNIYKIFLERVFNVNYMTAKEAAEKWGITVRRVQVLCAQDKIPGTIRFGDTWAIPNGAEKPADRRYKKNVK